MRSLFRDWKEAELSKKKVKAKTLSNSLKAFSKGQQKWKLRPELLLCPNVPKSMHGMAPRVILGQKWWNNTRQKSYRSTNFHCQACGIWKHEARGKKWLEGHELYDIDYVKGRMSYVETVPLCNYCHNYIHDGRMLALLNKGKYRHSKYVSVIQYGDRVLAEARLKRLTHEERDNAILDAMLEGNVAQWRDWRLVLFGKLYPPKFKTEKQWELAFR